MRAWYCEMEEKYLSHYISVSVVPQSGENTTWVSFSRSITKANLFGIGKAAQFSPPALQENRESLVGCA